MKELPGNVFVTGQLQPAQLGELSKQGVMSFINNRPDNEAPMQPPSSALADCAEAIDRDYFYIPMAGGLSQGLIEASVTAFANAPRPIVAFCASGMRSAALWAFAHVDQLGVDAAMEALSSAGFSLEQLRSPLMDYAARDNLC